MHCEHCGRDCECASEEVMEVMGCQDCGTLFPRTELVWANRTTELCWPCARRWYAEGKKLYARVVWEIRGTSYGKEADKANRKAKLERLLDKLRR